MRAVLKLFTEKEAHPAVQFVKYGIAGGIASVVDVFIFYLAAIFLLPALTPDDPVARLLGLDVAPIADGLRSTHYIWDKTIGFLIANFAAYLLSVLWVFTPGRHDRLKEFILFYLVSGTSFAIGTGIGWGLIREMNAPTTYAYVANGVTSVLINYVMRKYVVFKG